MHIAGLRALCDGLLLLPLAPGGDGGGGGAVTGVVAMHGRQCLWSSAGRGDTGALASLAAGALLPHGGGGRSAWRKLKGAALATAGRCVQQPEYSFLSTACFAVVAHLLPTW